jgi:small subunit ribosomal protein S17
MEEQNKEKKMEAENKDSCADKQCPFHGHLNLRGRSFKGYVVSKFPRRVAIEFERIIFIQKFERHMKKKTKIHARLPDCMKQEIEVGDYIEVRECRPLSKIIHFCVFKKIRSADGTEINGNEVAK